MKRKTTYALLLWLSFLGCRKDQQDATPEATSPGGLTLDQVKASYKNDTTGRVYWDKALYIADEKNPYWLAGLAGRPRFGGLALGYRQIQFYRTGSGEISFRILEIIPDALYLQRQSAGIQENFTGRVFAYSPGYRLVYGKIYVDGKQVGGIKPAVDKQKTVKTEMAAPITTCEWVDNNYVDADGNAVIYSEQICDTYVIDTGGEGDGLAGGAGIPMGPPRAGGGGGTGPAPAPEVSNLPGETKTGINPKDLMACFQNIPDKGATMKITIYVQEPWPGTTFNMGPNSVGHTAVSLTKTNGNQSITQTVGFYPDATGLDKMHAPSKLVDNGGDLEYNASISYSVNAENFNKIAAYISTPPATYDLTRFNCTDFAYNACISGGITLPDANDRPLLAPMEPVRTPGKLGDSIEKLKGNSNVNTNGGNIPLSHGPCK